MRFIDACQSRRLDVFTSISLLGELMVSDKIRCSVNALNLLDQYACIA